MKGRSILLLMAILAALIALLRTAGDLPYWRRQVTAWDAGSPHVRAAQLFPRVEVPGGGGQAIPLAAADEEGLAREAIDAAIAEARKTDGQMLVVQRHGHRIAAYFADGLGADTELAGGDLSAMPLALALGSMADAGEFDAAAALQTVIGWATPPVATQWRNPWSADARLHFAFNATPVPESWRLNAPVAQVISQRVWQPLGADTAAMWGDGEAVRLDCCFVASVDDWMRIADVLLQQGHYNGERIASAAWIRELLPGDTGPYRQLVWMKGKTAWTGDEPPAARDVAWADLGPDVRLWLLPQRGLAILHAVKPGSGLSTDTTVPNILIRGIVDQAASPSSHIPLAEMVPGH